jgi:hypothetical protein
MASTGAASGEASVGRRRNVQENPMSRITFTMLTLGLATLLSSQADARRVEIWSFERLGETADVVLIGTVASTEQWSEKLKAQLFAEDLEGQLTTFDVETVFKGKDIGKHIQVIHYRVRKGILIENGPVLASFRKTGRRLEINSVDGVEHRMDVEEGTPHYLLYLKKRSDGKYEPISGQIDSAFSVRKLSESTDSMELP